MVDDQFPAMKFFNIWDEYNMTKYNESQKPDNNGLVRTFR